MIVIKFNNNDLTDTYRAVGQALLEAHRYNSITDLSKKYILDVVNGLVNVLYPLYTGRSQLVDLTDEDRLKARVEFVLKPGIEIRIDHILIGEEARVYVQNNPYSNYEVLVVDFDLNHPGNEPVYFL